MATLTMEAEGREFTFRYSVKAICDAEEKYGSMRKIQRAMIGDDQPTAAALYLMACMANAHERFEKRPENFTWEWFRDHLSPKQLSKAKAMTQNAITVGWRREAESEEDVPVDVVLKEIAEENKKKEKKRRRRAGRQTDRKKNNQPRTYFGTYVERNAERKSRLCFGYVRTETAV